jgi:phosphatidylethanolamine/phosphatidyl-N-methylethanolamine N-methyltransferase
MTTTAPHVSYWNRHARNYDRSMALLGKPLPRMLELVAEAVRGTGRVLEVAAGTGLVTGVLAREAREVVATDYATAMVQRLEQRIRDEALQNVSAEQADLYALRFEAHAFDAVVAANVLHLVPDLPAALASLRRVVRPGGLLILPTFCHDETKVSWVLSRFLAATGFPGERRFTAASLTAALESAGIRLERQETIPGPIPVKYVHGSAP